MRIVRLFLTLAVAAVLHSQPSPSFRFAVLGDRTGGADASIYEKIWEELAREHPDFVINVGDTIEGYDDARASTEWAGLRPLFARFAIPLFATPGNHDIWSEASEKIFERETHCKPFYSFEHGGAHFTVLDNSRTPDLSERQLTFLEADLKATGSRYPRFVFFHNPFWIVPLKFGSGAFELHRLAKRYQVDSVLSGHGHQLVYLERDGVHYIEAGSSGASLQRGLAAGQGRTQGWVYGHLLATVGTEAVHWDFKEVGKSSVPLDRFP